MGPLPRGSGLIPSTGQESRRFVEASKLHQNHFPEETFRTHNSKRPSDQIYIKVARAPLVEQETPKVYKYIHEQEF